MIRRILCVAALVAATVLPVGCVEAHRVDIVSVFNSGNCGIGDAGVRRIDSKTLAELQATRLIGVTESPAAINNLLHLILIAPASYPTPGYAISLSEGAEVRGRLLTLSVKIKRPAPDAILAQMITHPCLVVGIADPIVGRVRVVDETAAVIGEVELPLEQ